MAADTTYLQSLSQTKEAVAKYGAEAVVKAALKRAEDDSHHALLSVIRDRALERAALVDSGAVTGRLAGVPFIAKDNYLTLSSETTAASNMLKGFCAPFQATAIERLEAEGAICIGKANLDAYAHGSSTENSDFGPTTNPHDPERVPGGSSGGSAAAVALSMVPFALGTDTGGSIRLPASFCGVVGYKPSYGLVSRYGVVAMGSSTDVIGPLAHSVADTREIMDILAGPDWKDSTLVEREKSYVATAAPDVSSLNIGVIAEFMSDDVDPHVKKQIEQAIKSLRAAGASVETVELPAMKSALACYYVVVPAEISSNLARYDGIRYGHTTDHAQNLEEVYANSRSEGLGNEAKRRIMIGNYVLSSGYYDAYYKKAMKVRTVLINQFMNAIDGYDALIGPVAPTPPFKLGEHASDPVQMYLADVMTVGVSLVGAPAISLPLPVEGELPVGLQVIGRPHQDASLLSISAAVEKHLELQS